LWVQLLTGVRAGCGSHHLLVFLNVPRDVAYGRELPVLLLILTFQGEHPKKTKSVKVDCAGIMLPAAEICGEVSERAQSHAGVYRDGR